MRIMKNIKELEKLGVTTIPYHLALPFLKDKPEWDKYKPKRPYKKRKVNL